MRDLDDLFAKSGQLENSKKILDLTNLEYDKLLGGGQISNAYTIKVKYATNSAQEKIKKSGGDLILSTQKSEEKPEEQVTNNDG